MRVPGLLLAGAAIAFSAPTTPSFKTAVQDFVARKCIACHGGANPSAGLNLAARSAADFATKDRDVWERVVTRVKTGEMPPKPLPRLKPAELDAFTGYVEREYARIDRAARPDPGRVTARRLNRYEYNSTIRDLLGVTFRPADDFPADDAGYGFDNIGDVLSVSPVLMEKYLAAAEQIARKAIAADPLPKPTLEKYKSSPEWTNPSQVEVTHRFASEGDFEIKPGIAGYTSPFKADSTVVHTVSVFVDGKLAGSNRTDTDPDRRRVNETRVHVTPGRHTLRIVVTPDACDLKPQLRVDNLEVRGPYNPVPPPPPESHRRIFACGHANGKHEQSCSRAILAPLLRRAFRRVVTPADVAKYERFIEMARREGDSFEQGVRVALQAVLVSPEFLFRIERDPRPNDPKTARRLTPFELATRLSYFLWSSLPDDELLEAAESGRLAQPAVLTAQVRRMLRDPKAFALVENFGGQWLELRNLESIQKDPVKFPEFDKELRAAMQRETQMFFDSIVREDRSILDFLSAKYTYLNGRLARFYGIAGVDGPEFRRVELAGNQRMGILTQASVLTISSYPTRTSPVIRGKYILENILNAPPPPPPPDVPNLDESKVGSTASLRQQLEKHRSNAICASCHSKMDPLGFGLENYDAIGRWRTNEGSIPIDASGTLPNGRPFSSPAEMMSMLVESRDSLARCLTEKLLTYALGRGLERYDRPAIQSISRRVAQHGYKFSGLVLEIVNSMPFQMRRGDVPERTTEDKPAPSKSGAKRLEVSQR
jgi:hypothetical protein